MNSSFSGIDMEDLRGIVRFMYSGVVTVPTANILRFMEAARELKIEGLASSSSASQPLSPPPDQAVSVSQPESKASEYEEIEATMKIEEDCNVEKEFYDLNQVSVSIPSNVYRKRKVNDSDVLVDNSNFEEFERSLLSKLWKDVDDQNKVVWKEGAFSALKFFTIYGFWRKF